MLRLFASIVVALAISFSNSWYASAAPLSEVNRSLQAFLYSEKPLDTGIKTFKKLEEEKPSNEVTFALGATHFLKAVEELQQDLYRLGAGNSLNPAIQFRVRSILPILRVPVPKNEDAETATYHEIRSLLENFVRNLEVAEKTLAKVTSEPFKAELDLLKIATDIDGNREVSEQEKLTSILTALPQNRRRNALDFSIGKNTSEMIIRFDNSDAKWLQGYSNLLLGVGKFLLSFNFEETYETSFHIIFGRQANEFGRKLHLAKGSPKLIAEIKKELEDVTKEIDLIFPEEQRTRLQELSSQNLKFMSDKNLTVEERKAKTEKLEPELNRLREFNNKIRPLRLKKNKIQKRLTKFMANSLSVSSFEGWLEPIAFLHSIDWPVQNPDLLKQVRIHWLKVMQLNYETWKLVQEEADNDKEWLPNANQTSPFPNVTVTQELIDEWLQTVRTGEKLLEGDLLIQSFRFGKGIDLRRFFETAQHFDLVNFLTGHASIDYLAEGQVLEERFFRTFNSPLNRNFGAFAIWFN